MDKTLLLNRIRHYVISNPQNWLYSLHNEQCPILTMNGSFKAYFNQIHYQRRENRIIVGMMYYSEISRTYPTIVKDANELSMDDLLKIHNFLYRIN